MVDVFSKAVFAGHDTALAHMNSQWLWLYSPHLEQIHLVRIPPWIRDWGKEACATPTLAEELFSIDGCWEWVISFLQKYSPRETTNATVDGSAPAHASSTKWMHKNEWNKGRFDQIICRYAILRKHKVNKEQWAIILLMAFETRAIEMDLILPFVWPYEKGWSVKEDSFANGNKEKDP